MFKKAAIIGTGLIGGSIALAIKKKGLAAEVLGVSRHKRTLFMAKKIGAIDAGSSGLGIIKNADLVVLAAPVGAILKLAPRIAKIIKKDCVVFDVASTKQEITAKLDKLFSFYVGTHPLAGSEKTGIAAAGAGIFRDSVCVITPTKKTDKEALLSVKKIWNLMGAKVIFLPPASHDKILSFTSHLPHAAAFSLINSVPAGYFNFSAGGLRDTTRIAASAPELWSGIFLSNRRNLLQGIKVFEKNLRKIKSAVIKKDARLLNNILKQAKNKRDALSK